MTLLALLGVLSAACSSHRKDDGSTQASSGGTTTTTKPDDGGSATKFGDLDSPCGKGDAKGATDQGVSDDKIVVGFGDDAGFQTSPGLSHETSDAMKAFMKWCNDQGGINGRQVEGKYYDAKITEVNNAVLDACKSVFMLVGEAWALDGSQEDTRLGCNLPAVPTYSVSADFANAPLMFQGVPNPIDTTTAEFAAGMAKLFPDKVKKTGTLFGNFSATHDTTEKAVAAYSKFGFGFLPNCSLPYAIAGEADWRPFAQKLKSCGAEVVYYSGQAYPNFQNFIDSAVQVGFKPIYLADANNYLASFAEWNKTGNGNDVYVRTAFTPFEQASTNKATQQYVDIVKKNGGDISQLGEQTTSAFLLWATAAKKCGSTLTRACVLGELAKVDSWTGGGLHAETNPAKNEPPSCGMILKMDGTKWVQVYPKEQGKFDCSPDYVVKITGRVVDQAQLGPDRVSTKHKK
jgi:ABC-type branched-subunit amino acid transport system substrate-binding protein